MRNWYKYSLSSGQKGSINLPLDQDFEDFKASMDGHESDNAYRSKKGFFDRHFFYQLGRLGYYDEFIRKHLVKEENALSIGSGRCANELYLMEDGYNITCSDVERPAECYDQTKALFPDWNFVELDILDKPSQLKYDTIIALSLIYLFDDKHLLTFFKNVSDSLTPGGHLILDSAGSPDNIFSYLIHDVLLKYEIFLLRIIRMLRGRRIDGFIRKHHGYRRTDKEIGEPALAAGLRLVDKEYYAFLTEFRRSILLKNLLAYGGRIPQSIFIRIGRLVPYIRMFYFEKEG